MKSVFGFLKKAFLGFLNILPFSNLTAKQWLYFPRLLSPKEKIAIIFLFLLALSSLSALVTRVYLKSTIIKPAHGGTYREGLIKEPRFINPIYASASDTDRDITELVFSGLIRYTKSGEVEPDLAETVEIGDDSKSYTVRLRNGLTWHDGKAIGTDDVLFTIKTIQNPEFKSPWRQNWQGVAIEKLDELTIKFVLKQPYAPFIENLTIGIIPEHLWTKITPQSAPLSDLNLKPVGSGPYKFESFTRLEDGSITSYTLSSFRNYLRGRPNINEIVFTFYKTETDIIAAYHKGEVDGIPVISAKNLQPLQKTDIAIYQLRLPRVIALFLNGTTQNAFTDKKIRLALEHAINKNLIITNVLDGAAEITSSPIPPGSSSFSSDIMQIPFDQEKSKSLLAEAGWKDSDNDGILDKTETKNRKKVITPLRVEIVTSDFTELSDTANSIKDMWKAVGIDAQVKILGATELETSMIRPRAYQTLLFGEIFGHDPDPFAFWHTSQIKDPGLNVALYSNRKADTLLEEARRITDSQKREEKYREFQKVVAEDAAAIFLFSPVSTYGIRSSVKGVEIERIAIPHERFSHIEKWHIKTRRGLK